MLDLEQNNRRTMAGRRMYPHIKRERQHECICIARSRAPPLPAKEESAAGGGGDGQPTQAGREEGGQQSPAGR